jgi:hypothetical protein
MENSSLTLVLAMIFYIRHPKKSEYKQKYTRWHQTEVFLNNGNKKIERQPMEWEKVFSKHMSDMALIFKTWEIHKAQEQNKKTLI